MRIAPKFDYASDFEQNGLARAQLGGRTGLIDATGRFVVPPVYDSINPLSEGRMVAIDKEGFKLLDAGGRPVTGRAYSYLGSVHGGRAVYVPKTSSQASWVYGYIDSDGREVIPARFAEANDFDNGRALVKVKENEYALIGTDGRRLMTYPFAFVGSPGNGRLPFQRKAGDKYGYLREDGAVAIAPAYTGAQPFSEGRAVVNTAEDYKNQFGLIDTDGRVLVQPGYNDIRQLGEQRLALGRAIDPAQPYIGSRFAIADNDGRLLTDFRYGSVESFENGLASVSDRTQTYFIDRSGRPAPGYPRLEGNGTLTLNRGLVEAMVDLRLSYFRPDGQPVWRQNTVIPLSGSYRVRELKYKPNHDYLVYYPVVEGVRDAAAEARVNERLKQLSGVKYVPGGHQLDYSYTGDFNVTFFAGRLLELELDGYRFPFGAAHGMPSRSYAHIDLHSGAMYQLGDLFKPGSNYVAALSAIVGKQIKTDPQYDYVFPDSYKGIKPDQLFYVTQHALHLVFEPYEIAPYAAGFPTFTIPFAEVKDLLAVNGPFWKSFH